MNPLLQKTAATKVPEFIYHGTSDRYLAEILKNGLRDRSYFTTEPVARWFAANAAQKEYGGGNPIIIRVPTKSLKLDDLDWIKNSPAIPPSLSSVKDVRVWRYLHPVKVSLKDVTKVGGFKTAAAADIGMIKNIIAGADFVTEKSDQSIISDEPTKELFVLLNNYVYGRSKKRLGWQWALSLSRQAMAYLDGLDWEAGEFKLVKTNDHAFTKGRGRIKQWGGWNLSRNPEQEQKLQDLWANAPMAKFGCSAAQDDADAIEGAKEAKSGPHKNATTQVNLPAPAAARMAEAAARFPDEELGKDGREDDFHVTIKYGVEDDGDLLRQVVSEQKPFSVILGKTLVFSVSESFGKQAPVVVEAYAPELEALHNAVNEAMGTREDDFPDYKPHATLAYVKPEFAAKYEGLDWLDGVAFPVTSITLSTKGDKRINVPFGQKTASHKTPPMSDTQYENPEMGEETNAYADIPERVKGVEDLPALEDLSPALFKTGAQNFKPVPFDNWCDANPMYQPDDFNEAEYRYDENIAHFSTVTFPMTVYRAVQVEKGTEPNLEKAGVYWTWVENSADAYFGSGSMWDQGGPHPKNPETVIIKAKVLRPTDVDWDATLLANMLNEEENEITVRQGAELQLVGVNHGDAYKKPSYKKTQKTVVAYGDDSKNLPMRGQKGIGGQDFPVMTEPPLFSDEKTAGKLKYLYHATKPRLVDEILKNGLKTQYSEEHQEWGESVYLTDDPQWAMQYGGALLRVDVSKLNKELLRPDDFEFRDMWEEIPEEVRENYNNWAHASWQMSLEYVRQCAYLQDIPANAIKLVPPPESSNPMSREQQQKEFLDARTVEEVAEHFAITPEAAAKAKAEGVVKASAMKTADAESYFTGLDEAAHSIITEFEQHIKDPKYRQKWEVVPAARLKKIWNDYAKTGMVRDEKGMGDIAWTVQYNIWKIHANTILCGHSEQSPIQFAENVMGENLEEKYGRDVFQDDNSFFDDDKGAWRLSDYALDPLINAAAKLENAKTAEQQLQAVDFILNIVHARSDLASWFVQGGTATLNSLAGYKKASGSTQMLPDEVEMVADVAHGTGGKSFPKLEKEPLFPEDKEEKKVGAAKTAAGLPSFNAWVKKSGGIWKVLDQYDVDTAETYGYGLEEPDDTPAAKKRYEKELGKRALADFQERYENLIAEYQSWQFPMDVFRCISLPSGENAQQQHLFPDTPQAKLQQGLQAIKYQGVGIYWSWDENSAECHWGSGGPNVTLHGIINKNNVDWEGTLYANMFPALGDDEKEVRLIEGTQFELEGIQYDEKSGWSQPPVKTVTAAKAKKRVFYHATSAANINGIAQHGLKPSEKTNWGGMLGDSSLGKTFFANTPASAMYYAMIIFRDKLEDNGQAHVPICLRVTIPEKIQLDTERAQNVQRGVHLPESEAYAPDEESWVTEGIPPANIQMFWQGKWQPIKAGDWEEMFYYEEGEGVGYVDWEGSPVGDSVPEAMADAESFTMPKKAGVMGQVYLLHFDIDPKEEVPSTREDAKKPFHARHYMGWAENAQERIDQHYKATSGVRLIEAIHAKGISFTVARIWDDVDRDFERRMKNQGGLNRHCPICKKLGLIPASRYRGKALEKQVAPETPEAGPDFVEIEKKAAAGDLANLRSYLTLSKREMGEELARSFSGYWQEFVENEHPEFADKIDEDGYTEDFDAVPENVFGDFLDEYSSRAMQDDPAMAPTFLTVDYRRDVKNAWLVHFSDYPEAIAKEGFRYGMDRVETLALTTYFKEDAKKFGGYNFALDAHHRNLEGLGKNYGKHCVLFQANGIETWHTGDDFEQIIFWGKDAKNIIPIMHWNDEMWHAGEDADGNSLFSAYQLSEVVEWAIANAAKLLPKKVRKPKASSEMTTLYHRTRPGREEQINAQGLSHIEGGGELWFTDDPSAYYGDSPNAVYSVDVPKEEAEAAHVGGHDYRFMGRSFGPDQIKKVAAEPWEMRQDEYAGRWNEQETEEQSGVRHQKNQDWEQNSLAALSLGKITPEQAKERGVYEAKSFIPLPTTPLYHVTTAKSQVESNGLKTRRELGQNYGKGLGGGTSMSISFTDDMSIAQGIYDNLLIARKVAAGEMTLDDLISTATKGMGANRPWIDDILKSLGGSNPKDKINVELDAIQRGVAFEHGLGRPPDDEAILPQYRKPGPWRPTPWSQHWKGGDGEEKYTYWERDLTAEEKQERVFEFFKKWSFWREQAGGGLDPLYFMSDPKALGQTPESEIAILTFKAVPGAMGTRESALGEWRVYTGAAVQLTGNAAAAKMGMFNPNRANVQYKSEQGVGEWQGWNIDFSADPVKEHMLPASFVRKLKGIEQKFINVADVVETQGEQWTTDRRVDEIHTQMEAEKWFEAILVDEYEDQPGKYYLEEGHHRTRAAKKMGKTTIPAVIMKLEPRKPHWSLSSGIVRKSSDIAKFAFLIEVPKDSRGHFWDEPPAHNLEFWAFRSRPPVLMNEKVYFTFDRMPVAETTVLKVEKPGESLCELSGKYEDHWKLYWEPKQFVKYAGTTAPTLYHGTCPENAEAIMKNGWEPNQVSSGGNAGQPQYLYLTNFPENAQWFANEKGCDTILEVRNIPMSYLEVDPEDGTEDTVERELNFSEKAFPGTVVLTKPLPADHFKVFKSKIGSLNEKRNEKWIYHPDYGAFSQKGSIGPHATLIARTMGEGMSSGRKYEEVLRGYAVIDVDQKTVTLATPTNELIPNDVVDLFKKTYPHYALSIPAESKAIGVTAAMPKKWYHGTSTKNAEIIMGDGYLRPDQETTYDIDIPRDGAVYIAEFDVANQYAIERGGPVLEVAAPDISKLLPDEDDVYELLNDRGGELNVKGSAQAKRVKALWLKQWNDENASYNEPEKFPIYKNFEEAWKAWGEIEFEGSAELAEQMKYLTDYIVKNDPKLARAIIELSGKAAHMGPLKVVRQVKTAAPKSIWYHGTSIKNLRSIMSQGLVPEGTEKVWADDPDAGISAPSRQSYGGIYVSQNLMTAAGAPDTEDRKARGGSLVVIMELQPNTMYLDEDNVTGVLGAPIKHMSDNTFHVLCYYLAATQEGATQDWQDEIRVMREDYVRKCFTQWEAKFAERKMPFHPELKAELEKLLPSVWLGAVTRAAGHVKDNYSYIRAWDQVFYGTPKEKQRPDMNTILPDASEGEAAFREAAEKVTRTLRLLARPNTEGSQTYNINTSRINEPIGFSGSNHILALVEVRDLEVRATPSPVRMLLHWGTIPPDFFTQWNIKFGSKYEVVDARKGQPKAKGVAASAHEDDPQVFYHGTSWQAAQLIDKEGLKASDNRLTGGKKYIWCAIAEFAAKEYGASVTDSDQYAVIEFIWDYGKSEPDPEHFEEGDMYRRIEGDIPRSAITKISYFDDGQIVKTAAVEDEIKIITAPDGRITAKHVDGKASGTMEDREGLAKWFECNTLPQEGAQQYDKAFVLGTVTVKVTSRRTGLGRALVGAVLDAAKTQGAKVCFLLAQSLTGLSAKELSAFYSNLGFQPYVIDPPPRWFDSSTAGIFMKKLAGVAKFAAMNHISQQDAVDRKMFGPVYHGTTEEKQESIGNEGFKVYIGDAGSGDVAHGYEGNQPYHDGIPAPVHHLGFGIYLSTNKTIAKQFAGGTTRGMKSYYLDVPRLETINFGVPKTMMKWWISQGYNGKLAKKDRVEATKQMTEHLKAQFDAVWFKGKGMYKLLDGDQICVFDSSRIYEVDAAMSKSGDIGSKVIRKADGMKGVIKNVRSIPPDVAQQYHGGADKFYEIKWTKGGTDHNVYARDIEFVGAPKAQGATASKTASFFCVACDGGDCIEHESLTAAVKNNINKLTFGPEENNDEYGGWTINAWAPDRMPRPRAQYEGPVGFINIGIEGASIEGPYVYDINVEDDWRGTGLGQQLYDLAVAEAKKRGYTEFNSSTDQTPEAKAAWKRLSQRYLVTRKQDKTENLPYFSMKLAEGFNDEGFWAGEGNAASGVLPICTTTQRICLAWRSPDVHIGDCWGTIGGACKPKMSLAESAKAELTEETGFNGGITMHPAYVFSSGSFSYHNFLGTVGTEFRFAPQSEHHWETTGLEWFTWDEIQQMVKEDSSDFHPGLISLFKSDGKKIEQLLGKPKTASEKWYRNLPSPTECLDCSAADVIRHQEERNDMDYGFDPEFMKEMESVPARALVWVTKTPEAAAQYGEDDIHEVQIGDPEILVNDGEDGYLVLDRSKIAAGDDGDMPNPLQVFPERPDVMETFRHMRPFERDRLIEEASLEMVNPADLKTNQKTVTKKTVQWFMDNPEEIRKPRSNVGLSDTEQLYPLVCKTSDGLWLYDGNHRSAAALKLGMEIEAKIVDLTDYEEPQEHTASDSWKDEGLLNESDMKKWKRYWDGRGHSTQIDKAEDGLYHCWIKFATTPARALRLYHVTTVPIAKDIKAHGFKSIDQGVWQDYYAPQGRDGIYFYDDLKYSDAYAAHAEGKLWMKNLETESWDKAKANKPQMAIIEAQVPENIVVTTDEKEDGFFVPTADLNKIKITGMYKFDYVPTEGRQPREKFGATLQPTSIDALSKDTQADIAFMLAEENEFLLRAGYDESDVKSNLIGMVDEPKVLLGKMPVEQLYKTFNRKVNKVDTAVAKYVEMLKDPQFEFDPILVVDGKFYEGGHRMEAYHRAERTMIPVVDVTNLVKAPPENWEAWMNGEDVTADQMFPIRKQAAAFPTFEQVMDEITLADDEFMFGTDEESKRWYDQALAFWKSQSFPLTIYRGLAVFDERHEINYNTFGWSWSLDKGFAQRFAEDKYIDYPDKHRIEVYEGKITANAVDWLNTFRAWVTIPEEKEVRLKAGAKVQIPALSRTVTAADDMKPRSKYDKVCHTIATDDALYSYFADYVQCADAFEDNPAASGRVVELVKSLTPFVPPTTRKCLYRGEEIRMGDDRLPAEWEPHLRDLLSWSVNYDTARGFAGHRGIVWKTVGKIQGIALEDIVRWRNWTHPNESNYPGMQSEWFVMNTCNAKEADWQKTGAVWSQSKKRYKLYHGGDTDLTKVPTYFTNNKSYAKDFGEVSVAYVTFNNPLVLNAMEGGFEAEESHIRNAEWRQEQIDKGYDGLIVVGSDAPDMPQIEAYIPFSASQVQPVILDGSREVLGSEDKTASKTAAKTTPMDADWKQRVQQTNAPALEADPALRQLHDKILEHGGEEAMVGNTKLPPEEIERLLTRGQYWDGKKSKRQPMEANHCHGNSKCLMKEGVGEVANGYALSKDGLWRYHSWVVTPTGVIETTTPREGYFGAILTMAEVEEEYTN